MLKALYDKDVQTAKHCLAVASYMSVFFNKYASTNFDSDMIFLCGLLHDIGKIKFPSYLFSDFIVSSEDDWNIIKAHTIYAKQILEASNFPYDVVKIVFQHHEKKDGSGYPLSLSLKEIFIEARVLAIADCYTALTEERAYRSRVASQDAVKILVKDNRWYDNRLLRVFIENINDITLQAESLYNFYFYKELREVFNRDHVKGNAEKAL